jgi:Leucine-rich repeat (LRR) protein
MDWLDAQNYTTLSEVYLARTGLTADGLGWLTNCAQLTALSLDGIALTDLSVCSNLAKLTDISAVNCGIEDVSGLAGCPELLRIYLGANKISDVSTLKLESENPVTLDLTGNQLSTLEGLPQVKYRALVLYANATDNAASVIPDGLEALEVVTPYFDGIESSPLTNYSRFSTVYVVDCPQNQVLKLQEAFSASLKLVSEDELLDLYENDGFTYALHTDSSYLVSVLKGSSSGTGFPEIADAVTEMESITFDIGN